MLEAILLTIVTASTPLLFAAMGELVTERSGVLNLGVEGMMAVGAVFGFVVGLNSGSHLLGIIAAGGAGMTLSLLFAILVLGLGINQVASGLALTLLGLGLSGLAGTSVVGRSMPSLEPVDIPLLSDLPVVGQLVFGQTWLVYLSLALVAAVGWFIDRTRQGLLLRAVGDDHHSAHTLGHSVMRIRLRAIIFGGLCAGIGGGYLSLAYTPLWIEGMVAGRGWIAVALVVFASWTPWRVLLGAYLFGAVSILQLHSQAMGIGIPSQALTSLPYIATVLVLVLIGRDRLRMMRNTPACLGVPFVPTR